MPRLPALSPFVLTVLTVCSSAFAQRIWIVDASRGTGYHFVDVQSAVNRAAAGDRIRIRAGTYAAFAVSKGVAFVGEANVKIRATSRTSITVSGLPLGQVVAMRNLDAQSIETKNCIGPVVFDQVHSPVFRFDAARHAAISGAAAKTISAKNSTLAVTNSAVDSSTLTNTPAIVLTNSRATVAGCSVTGGQHNRVAIPAIQIDRTSRLTLTGTNTSFVRTLTTVWRPPALPAIDGTGELILDPRVRLIPAGSWAIKNTIRVTRRTVPFVDPRGGALGQRAQVTMHGEALAVYYLALGVPGVPIQFPTLHGTVHVDLRTAVLVGAGRLDTRGQKTFSIPVPNDNRLFGVGLIWQGLSGRIAGNYALSNPAAQVLGL